MKILAIAALAAGIGGTLFQMGDDYTPGNPVSSNAGRTAPVAAPFRTAPVPASVPASIAASVVAPPSRPTAPQRALTHLPHREHAAATARYRPDGGGAGGAGPVDISGVHPIELTPEELARLGIRADSSGVCLTWRESETDEPFSCSISMWGTSVPYDGTLLDGIIAPRVVPSIITDDLGGKRMFVVDDGLIDNVIDSLDEQIPDGEDSIMVRSTIHDELIDVMEKSAARQMQAGRMVPILVRTGHPYTRNDSAMGRWRPDCIIWYAPKPELLAMLPERVRKQLTAEIVEAASLIEREGLQEAHPNELHELKENQERGASTGDRPYLDILRSTSGALVSTSLVPNPTAGASRLTYRLATPRTVTISLHDLSGRVLRRLDPPAEHAEGTSEAMIDTEGLSEGIYLVVISTDKGERAVQRLIVRK